MTKPHNILSPLAAILALTTVTAAESTTTSASSCNPMKTSGCSPNKALATSFLEDFSSESDYFHAFTDSGTIEYTSDGLALTLKERFDNPGLKSDFYIMYGKVEVILKAANGTGVVTSFYLQSDDLDEIDLEWLGGDTTEFQSNFFSKGNVETYDRGAFHGVYQPQIDFHNYTIDWGMDKTVWYLDGCLLYTSRCV